MGDGGKARWIWRIGVGFWCFVLAGALSANRVLSLSVDSSYHLQVMEVVRHAFLIPEKGHEWMAEMAYYPKLSHRFAGLFATLGWRHLNALTMAGVLSAAVVWACLFAQARRVSLIFLGAGAALTVVNIYASRAAFGGELIDNFFFPQIVGEAVNLACLVGAVALLPRSRPIFVAYAVAAVVFCGCFHLVPTLQLAGALMAMLGVTWLRELIATRRFEPVGLVGLIAIPAAIVLNPFFAKMRFIAGNNGSLNLGADLSMEGLAGISALLLVLSGWVLLAELLRPLEADEPGTEESNRAALMFAALGAACAAAMLAQYAAFKILHDGSHYAVMKHSFGVLSLLAFIVPLWGLTLLGVRSRLSDVPANWPWPLGAALAFGAQTVVMLCLFLRPSVFDVPRLNAVMEDVRQVRVTRGLSGDQVMFSAAGLPPISTYMATIAMLQSPHGPNVLSLMADGRPDRVGDVPHVVTLVGDAYDKPGCREGAPIGQVVVVAGPCLEPPSLRFKAGGSGVPYLREGWSVPEAGGVWADGKRSIVEIPIAPWQRALKAPRLEAAMFAFLPTPFAKRTVIVSVPGGVSERFVFDRQVAVSHAYVLALPPEALKGDTLRVTIDTPDAVMPKAIGLSPDTRLLGAGLEAMRIADGAAK
ncbi:hypothetical protein [uncultured Caulobacter sp.]|uniref:hypothetical protein n=1 Tax=uncultured Caulobacter sp. TaxID=158749 RepID=UPI00261C21F5|nr:hypothetical protein [uncultured Caulobacter sp.]